MTKPNIHAVPGDDPGDEPSDPFDTERLRSVSLENIGVEKITLTIPVRRPGRNEFFASILIPR